LTVAGHCGGPVVAGGPQAADPVDLKVEGSGDLSAEDPGRRRPACPADGDPGLDGRVVGGRVAVGRAAIPRPQPRLPRHDVGAVTGKAAHDRLRGGEAAVAVDLQPVHGQPRDHDLLGRAAVQTLPASEADRPIGPVRDRAAAPRSKQPIDDGRRGRSGDADDGDRPPADRRQKGDPDPSVRRGLPATCVPLLVHPSRLRIQCSRVRLA